MLWRQLMPLSDAALFASLHTSLYTYTYTSLHASITRLALSDGTPTPQPGASQRILRLARAVEREDVPCMGRRTRGLHCMQAHSGLQAALACRQLLPCYSSF